MQNRMISTELVEEDIKIENHLRPQMLSDYIGQEKVKENLKILSRERTEHSRNTGSNCQRNR